MKLSNIVSESELTRLRELTPPAPGAAPMAAPAGTMTAQDPQAAAKLQAQQVIQVQQRKKAIQDQIRQKQQEIQDLQKELASIK